MLSTVRLRCAYGEAGVWSRGQPGRSCLQQADTSSAGPKCPSARVLHGLGAWAKPGAKRQTQEGVAGWPDFDPDFAEEPGLIEQQFSLWRFYSESSPNPAPCISINRSMVGENPSAATRILQERALPLVITRWFWS